MATLLRRSYAISAELAERISSLAIELSDRGLGLSDGAIVRMALDRGLPIVEEYLLGKGIENSSDSGPETQEPSLERHSNGTNSQL